MTSAVIPASCGVRTTFVQGEQRIVGGERLLMKHIERRAGDSIVPQRVDQ